MRKLNILLALLVLGISSSFGWKRSSLIYNRDGRDSESWKRHLMRIDASGSFTGQWLFDAAIISLEKINGKDIIGNFLTQKDLQDMIETLLSDATKLEEAMSSLTSQFGNPNLPIQVFIGFPHFNPGNNNLEIDGEKYDLSIPERRVAASKWYLNRFKNRVGSKSWRYFNFGVYYHLEEVPIQSNDSEFVKKFNDYVHQLNMKSVWVPFYDVFGFAFNGTQFGFDTVIIQPRYSFLSSIDGSILKGDRLYSTGYKAASQGQCLEYEARGQGESEVEHVIAHQYLAISQYTGCDQFPQTYFFGDNDIFDKVSSKDGAPGKMWETYEDLANYLGGGQISNMEVGIDTNFRDVSTNVKELDFLVEGTYLENLNAIRLDFKDNDNNNPWKGKLSVLIEGSQARSSFAYRIGTDDVIPEHNSVFVPLSNERINSNNILIRLDREEGSPWPNILRLVASKYEPLYVANPSAYAISTSSVPVQTSGHQDSVNTQSYAGGKLTDGRITNAWWDGNAVGWFQLEKRVTITIDLGSVRRISQVKAYAWRDIISQVNFPQKFGVIAANDCEPQERGTLNGCVPTASTGSASIQVQRKACGEFCDRATFTAQFGRTVSARYVTISFVTSSWALLDEVQVLENNQVISGGRPYRVTPVPGHYDSGPYTSDGQNLADGAIFKDFIFGRNVVGIEPNKGGNVELNWLKPLENMNRAIIWMTNANGGFGIGLPARIDMQWRNENGAWQQSVTTQVNGVGRGNCTASPCAALALPRGSRVTGVRGVIPSTGSWTMISEISLM